MLKVCIKIYSLLQHVLPQHCITYNDVFLLIISTKV